MEKIKMAFKKSKYTNSQKIAYYSGMGYRVSHEGRGVEFKNKALRTNFKSGYDKAGTMMLKNPNKYPMKKKGGK